MLKNTKKFLFIFVLFIGFYSSQAQGFKPKLANELQHDLDSFVAMFNNTVGMSAAVYAPGNGIWKGASGISKTGVPLTSDMEFGIASNSKLFTAVVLLKLAENNILSLDDSLHTWLDTFKQVDPNITIRQLLNHTSGVSDPIFVAPFFDSMQANLTRKYTPEEVLSYLGTPLFKAGQGYGYSNVNYILAGMVAQSATGFHISKLIRDNILTPLNMDSTFYDIEEAERGTIAHRWYNGVDFHDSSRISLNTAGGAAGSIFSTGSEMVQWYNALLHGQIINKKSIAEMTNFANIGSYGLGITKLNLFGAETWGHGGRTLGYKSRMFYDPCAQVTTCGLTNSDPSAVDGVTALLHKKVLDRLPACPETINGATKVCKGSYETYIIHPITRATTYEWTLPNGQKESTNNNSVNVYFDAKMPSGKITLRAVNEYGYGLPVEIQIEVTQIPLSVSISNGNTITLDTAAESYQWLNCDSNYAVIPNANAQSFKALKSGNYALAVLKNNCWDTTVCVAINLGGLQKYYTQNIFIHPNPFCNTTTIGFVNSKPATRLVLLNMLGQTVKEINFSGGKANEISLNRDGLLNGIYNLILVFEDDTWVYEKLLVRD